jgi:hypothetical protein
LSSAELLLVLGALVFIVAYQAAVARPDAQQGTAVKEWKTAATVQAGLLLWAIGAAGTWIWQVYRYRNAFEVNEGFGEWTNFALVLARLLHPLGMMLLAYALATTRNRLLLALVLTAITLDVVIGFIGDTKEIAMRGVLLVIFAKVLVGGKLPKGWLVTAAVFVLTLFPVFQAYRSEVMGVKGQSRAQAAANIWHSIELALQSREKVTAGKSDFYANPSFLGRNDMKPAIEMLIDKMGNEAPYQDGRTLVLFVTALVPRMLWPDKPDISVGQLFNRELHLSEDPDTYISPSFVGDMYWNFGSAGVLAGMAVLGYLLGFVNRRCDMSQHRSVPRLLVLASTIYALCVRFEDGIALELIVWARTLVAIGVMNLVFARTVVPAAPRPNAPDGKGDAVPVPSMQTSIPRYSNLMR